MLKGKVRGTEAGQDGWGSSSSESKRQGNKFVKQRLKIPFLLVIELDTFRSWYGSKEFVTHIVEYGIPQVASYFKNQPCPQRK